MKKKLKPRRRKGVFSFLNKEMICYNLLKIFMLKSNESYRIISEDSSYSNQSGDIHFRLQKRPGVHSLITVDVSYNASNGEVRLKFFKSILPKNLGIESENIIKSRNYNALAIKSLILNWLEKEIIQGYKIHVVFMTEFPLFDYHKTLYVQSIGSTLAKDIVDDIFGKEALSNRPTELERFRQAFRSARHMCDCTLHCSVVSLATDKEVEHKGVMAGDIMATEIGNQIYRRLTPPAKPDNVVSRKQYYWETVVNFFSSLFSRGRKIPSY